MTEEKPYFVHPSSYVDDNVTIGAGTKIWHFSHVQAGAVIGENCSLGQNVNVSNNVHMGRGCKVQNNVSLYEGVELEDYVFCGPSCVFTNDLTPRAQYPKGHTNYKKTLVHSNATIGANATIVCGHELGEYCTIAAGAVVTHDVPAHALMAGIPARQVGWTCECGQVLRPQDEAFVCPDCGRVYTVKNALLKENSEIGGGRTLTDNFTLSTILVNMPIACGALCPDRLFGVSGREAA